MAPLRFHWMLPKGGEMAMQSAQQTSRVLTTQDASPAARPDMSSWIDFARCAEEAGIDSVLISFSRYEPDTLMTACAMGQATQTLKFIAACRLGLSLPTLFVQQVNTLSGLIGGRIALNIVAGSSPAEQRGYGDFLDHNERYARAEEFLSVCHQFWQRNTETKAEQNIPNTVNHKGPHYHIDAGKIYTPFFATDNRISPEIFVAGHSPQAQQLACNQGSAWLRLIDTPETLEPEIKPILASGKQVCLRLGLVCRQTRQEALHAAKALLPSNIKITKKEREILGTSDSQTLQGALAAADSVDWLNSTIWTGLVPHYGSSAMTLVGSYDEVAEAFLNYKRLGITQFIISGWPKLDEMMIFGREVLPLIRRAEHCGGSKQ